MAENAWTGSVSPSTRRERHAKDERHRGSADLADVLHWVPELESLSALTECPGEGETSLFEAIVLTCDIRDSVFEIGV